MYGAQMVMELAIEPFVGVGAIKFGFHKNDVVMALGPPPRGIRAARLLYASSAQQIHLDENERVNFIEVGTSALIRPTLHGVALLEIAAEDAIDALSRLGTIDRNHPEFPMLCMVPAAGLSLWRTALPNDDSRGKRFEAIGCGREGYFSRDRTS